MKKISTLFLTASLFSLFNANFTSAQEAAPAASVSSELDIVSKYVWRGMPLSETEAYQPSVTLESHGLTANAWLNYSVDKPQQNKFSELDLALNYAGRLKDLTVSPGFLLYTFPGYSSYGEAYVKLCYPVSFFKIITDHYFSMIAGDIAGGYYGDAGLGYEKPLANSAAWTSSALLGWGNAKFNSFTYATPGLKNQLSVLVLDTAIAFKTYGNGSVRPHLAYQTTLPGALRSGLQAAGKKPDNVIIGVAVSHNF